MGRFYGHHKNCPECGRKIENLSGLRQHYAAKHPNLTIPSRVQRPRKILVNR